MKTRAKYFRLVVRP